MAQKKKTVAVDQEAPVFTKEQLVKSKTLGVPQDAVAAILKDGQTLHTGRSGPPCDRLP